MMSRRQEVTHPWWCEVDRCHVGIHRRAEHRSVPHKFGPLVLTMAEPIGQESKRALEIRLRVRLSDTNGDGGEEHAKRLSEGVLHAAHNSRNVRTAKQDHIWHNQPSDHPTTTGGAQW